MDVHRSDAIVNICMVQIIRMNTVVRISMLFIDRHVFCSLVPRIVVGALSPFSKKAQSLWTVHSDLLYIQTDDTVSTI